MISKESKISVHTLKDSTFTLHDVHEFMKIVDEDFVPRFSSYVNISEYLKKLMKYAEILLATDGNIVLGIIAFYCNNITGGISYITYLAIRHGYRGKGLAEKLLMKCIKMAKAAEMKKVQTRTWNGNKQAVSLYEKFGFRLVRKCADRADGSTSIYLELELKSV